MWGKNQLPFDSSSSGSISCSEPHSGFYSAYLLKVRRRRFCLVSVDSDGRSCLQLTEETCSDFTVTLRQLSKASQHELYTGETTRDP